MATRSVTGPDGTRWRVRRRWVKYHLRWRGPGNAIDFMDGSELAALGAELPLIGVVFLVIAIVLFAIAAVVFIIPALVFFAEVLVVVALVVIGVGGRVLLGRPWTVEAAADGDERSYEWHTSGWRASGELRDTVARQLEATGLPTGGTPS